MTFRGVFLPALRLRATWAAACALPLLAACALPPTVDADAPLPDASPATAADAALPASADASTAAASAPVAPSAAPTEAPAAVSVGTPEVPTVPTVPTEAAPPAVPAARPVPAPNQLYAQRADVRDFAAGLASRGAVSYEWSLQQLEQARYIPQVARLMMPPPAGSVRDWSVYRARFVEPKRILAGAEFWRANRKWLDASHDRWGVPPWLVVGIVGVETFYGRITGSFRVIDALATLSFDFPTGRRDRTPFFRAQLREFLQWCAQEGRDPQSVLGSYAGAIGLPQFMPGSITSWAIDFDEDGHIDLMGSGADVVGSVGHYMAAHGWQRDMPTHYPAAAPTDTTQRATLLQPDIKPSFSAADMQALGAQLHGRRARAHDGPLALIELQNGLRAPPSFVAGTENFYAVTRYNWSSFYAMAVIELGQAVHAVVVDGQSAERAAMNGVDPLEDTAARPTPVKKAPRRGRTVAQAR